MSKRPRKSSASASSSSTPSYDKNRFISFDAFERYKELVVSKSFVQERGFNCLGTLCWEQAESRGWLEFVKHPKSAVVPVVREFYANIKEHQNKKVFVRGKWVPFDSKAINKLYELQDVDDTEFQEFRKNPDTNAIIRSLTHNRVKWKESSTDVVNFPSSGLEYEKKAWHYIISAKLLPTSNTYEVTKERAILNYAIFKGFSINVGKIIEQSIWDTVEGKTTGGLGHPALIYALCVAKGVTGENDEEVIHPQSEITRKKIESYKSKLAPLPDLPFTQEPDANSSQQPSSSSSVADLHSLTADMAQMKLYMAQILRRQDAMVARHDAQFQYLIATLQSCHHSNQEPDAIAFPQEPVIPPFPPAEFYTTTAPEATTVEGEEEEP